MFIGAFVLSAFFFSLSIFSYLVASPLLPSIPINQHPQITLVTCDKYILHCSSCDFFVALFQLFLFCPSTSQTTRYNCFSENYGTDTLSTNLLYLLKQLVNAYRLIICQFSFGQPNCPFIKHIIIIFFILRDFLIFI